MRRLNLINGILVIMAKEINKSNGLNEAACLLLLTSISYVAAYAYELSYLKFFGIPSDFITVNLNSLVITGISVVVMLGIIYQGLDLATTIINEEYSESVFAHIFNKYSLLFVPSTILVLLADTSILYKLFLIIFLFPMMWFYIILPAFERKLYGSYTEAYFSIIKSEPKETILSSKLNTFNIRNFLLIIVSGVYIICASHILGFQTASSKDEFLIDKENRALIRAYDKSAILGVLDGNELVGKYVIKELKDIEFEKKAIELIITRELDADDKLMNYTKHIYESITRLFTKNENST